MRDETRGLCGSPFSLGRSLWSMLAGLSIHHFSPHVWGTVGQWFAAVGTLLAFTAAFYVIVRDARVRERTQASKVALYVVRTPRTPEEIEGKHRTWYDLTVKNLSDEPIY